MSEERKIYANAFMDILCLLGGANSNRDLQVAVWALIYELGLDRALTSKNPSQKAKELGVTRAVMSYWRCYVRKELGPGKTVNPNEYRRPKSRPSKK